jgi:hypothetical protein
MRLRLKSYLTNFASSEIGTLASALLTGQTGLGLASGVLEGGLVDAGNGPLGLQQDLVIANPSPCFSNDTSALVWIFVGLCPPSDRMCDSAIEKHPAWAAAMSSSGLVPGPSRCGPSSR